MIELFELASETLWAIPPAAIASATSSGGGLKEILGKLLDKPAEQLGGLIQGVTSLFGGGRRRREQRQAQDAFDKSKALRRSFDKKNVYEGLTVNQQAADFQQAGIDQNLANIAQSIQAGGAGPEQFNQLIQQSNQATQTASLDIAKQEQENQLRYLQEESNIQDFESEQLGENLKQDASRLSAANKARQQATRATVQGFGKFVGASFEDEGIAGGVGGDNATLLRALLNRR